MKKKVADTYTIGKTVLGGFRLGPGICPDGGAEDVPDCLLLEDGGAWLWEDGTPVLLEKIPQTISRVSQKQNCSYAECNV